MSIRNLEYLLRPRSIAVIGASTRQRQVGNLVMRNLLEGGFDGPIMPVNPKYGAVAGVMAHPDIGHLPLVPDLAVICTPPQPIPALVDELGRMGVRAAVIMTAALRGAGGEDLTQAVLDAARPYHLRILGPNSLGLNNPAVGLSASFAHRSPQAGSIAFVSQSGALGTAVLDWAQPRGIGFSHFISVGRSADVDVGDLLDYLGGESNTKAILLYLEAIGDRRKFMSAARAAARAMPVLAIKSGQGAHAVGAAAGADEVFDAAIRRAGMLRVYSFSELFSAVETLARRGPLRGDRLAIITNGNGPDMLATDELLRHNGRLAELSPDTMAALDRVLPPTWSRRNPVDILGGATGERYAQALDIVLQDAGVDAVLVMHAPIATASSEDAAREVTRTVAESKDAKRRAVLTNWLGDEAVHGARRIFGEAGIRSYRTPEEAVRGFLHMLEYRRNQELLIETPPSAPQEITFDTAAARAVVATALAEGRTALAEPEAKEVLSAYGIPVAATRVALDAAAAGELSAQFGGPVALKIVSPDIAAKSDVGGVVLDLEGPAAVRAAAEAMLARVRRRFPDAAVPGFTVQEMVRWPRAWELVVGVVNDALFGPVIVFGQGGTGVELIQDRAVALPPLNLKLARELISRTRIFRLLEGFRDHQPADLHEICLTLMRVSQLLIDLPEVAELDINPLLADHRGVMALDARLVVQPWRGGARLAIRPYPKQLEERYVMRSGREVLLRPIRPEDEAEHYAFLGHLTPEDTRYRFFSLVRELSHAQMARLTQIDYDREMAFIASATNAEGEPETLGVVRTVTDPNNQSAEFAIAVRSDLKGEGLGRQLMTKMIAYCRQRGTGEIVGQVLLDNHRMLRLADSLGFEEHDLVGQESVEVRLVLNGDGGSPEPAP